MSAVERAMAVLVQLDHMDDWTRGFGATVDELEPWERDALHTVAMEILSAVEESESSTTRDAHDATRTTRDT